jgi:acyl-coenzyme A synthetase/AMP-(fatty) acid ligase
MSIVSLSDLIAGARAGSHCVAIQDGREIALSKLRADVCHNADRLAAGAVRRGAVVCENGYWFIVGVLALRRIGADVILPPNVQAGTLRSLASEFDAFLTDSEALEVSCKALLESGRTEAAPFHIDLDNGRIDFFTSGSTGEIKRVEKSLTLFEREVRVLEEMWGGKLENAVTFGTVTHQHVFGMTFRIMWPILAGRPFQSEFHIMWEPLIGQLHGSSILISSPAQLTRLGGLAPVPPANRPRMIITAGAPLPAGAAIDANKILGRFPTEIFGSTEAGAIAWRRGPAEPVLWQTLPSIEVRARADGVMLLHSPHASGHGWCEQADRVSFAADGRFRLEGRIDRVHKVEGKRVSLNRLEREIAALEWVREAAVAVLGGNRAYLGAVVILSAAGVAELERIGKFRFERILRRELSSTEDTAVLPRRWRFVDRMPNDGLGKRPVRDVIALLEQLT